MRSRSNATTDRSRFRFKACAFALAIALPAAAPAKAGEFSVGAHGGVSLTNDDEVQGTTIDYGTGYGYGFTAGYEAESVMRIELETTYRENEEDPPVSGLSNDTLIAVTVLGNA